MRPTLALCLSWTVLAAAAGAQVPVVLDEQLAVHGPSQMRGFASTPDGEWLFVS